MATISASSKSLLFSYHCLFAEMINRMPNVSPKKIPHTLIDSKGERYLCSADTSNIKVDIFLRITQIQLFAHPLISWMTDCTFLGICFYTYNGIRHCLCLCSWSRTYTLALVYDEDHPKLRYGSSVKAYPLSPTIDELQQMINRLFSISITHPSPIKFHHVSEI